MSVADELTKLQTNLSNSYSACEEKGATLPAQQNFDNLSATISSIESGNPLAIPRDVENGVLINNATSYSLPNDITEISDYCLYGSFRGNENITTVNLGGVKTVGTYGLYYFCYSATALSNFDLSNLETVGNYGLCYSFYDTAIQEADLSHLTSIGTYALDRCFGNSSVKVANLNSLTSIPNYACRQVFEGSDIEEIYMDNLTEVRNYGLQYACRNCTNIKRVPDFSKVTTATTYSFGSLFYGARFETPPTFSFDGLTAITSRAFDQTFHSGSTGMVDIESITYPNLETISAMSAFYNCFMQNRFIGNNGIVHMFPKLRIINGSSTFSVAYRYTRLYKFIFDSLEEIGTSSTNTTVTFSNAFEYSEFKNPITYEKDGGVYFPVLKILGKNSSSAYAWLSGIVKDANNSGILDFPELTTVYNSSSTNNRGAMTSCGAIKVYMPKVTSLGTYNIYNFYNSTSTQEIHFSIENQATIEAMSGYSSKFGASNATIYFDLINHITVGGVVYDRYGKNYDYDNGYYSWNNGDTVIYTTNEYTPAVGDSVYTKTDGVYTETGTIEGVA